MMVAAVVELEYIWIFSSDEIFYKLKLTGGGGEKQNIDVSIADLNTINSP